MITRFIRVPGRFIQNSLPFKKFEQLSLKNKLLISFIFVSVVPLLLVQTFSYYNSTISMKQKIDELIHFNLIQTSKNIDTTLSSYRDLVIQIFSNDKLIEQVKQLNSGSEIKRLLAANEIKNEFSIISISKPGIKCISLLAASGEVAWYDWDTNSGVHSIWSKYPVVTQTEVYRNALRSERWILSASDMDQYAGQEYHFINIALKFVDWKSVNREVLGVIVLSFNTDYLYNSCNQPVDQPGGTVSFNFIYDSQGRIMCFPRNQYLGKHILPPGRTVSGQVPGRKLMELIKQAGVFGMRPFTINQLPIEKNGWTIVNAIDQNYLFNQMYWMQRLTVVFGILAVLFSVMIITYVTSTLSRSTNKIVAAMNSARKGELSVQVDLDTKDEIAMIGSHFNQMMVRLQQLMEEVKLATGNQKEAEIKALVAQINPHFLYNMLDSINWMAIEKDEHAISQMIESLANILRYSINDSNWVVTLREEVEWLKQYIYLQQNHFEDAFESVIHFDEDILDGKIYKLLLQPLVENAIVHGFKGYTSGGRLTLKGTREGECLKITIEDNGQGISPETLELITRDLEERRSFSGIGLKNVNNRLRNYYGAGATLSFSSQAGVGTKVTLLIAVL